MTAEKHYDKKYFEWQKNVGIFGAKANKIKFEKLISDNLKVLDFGCGGGYLLNEFKCEIEKHGVEINEVARSQATKNGLKCYKSSKELPSDYFDLIISNNALEHCENPFLELNELYRALKKSGKICLVVPLDSLNYKYKKDDKDFHLYSWSPMNLGNILKANNFEVIASKPFIHKWFPFYNRAQKIIPWWLFHLLCFVYGRLDRKWFQTRAVAIKK
jgi:SAM-dependent methyltransferase|tara:strand:- start:369 stop:1016 length:648 start_codon:yes stop_codon:yes gene_type:complete